MARDWQDQQVIYQIYPKSFKDTNHDGIGDLPGIIEKLPYLKDLGVTTIWLNPIFGSPQVDNGYDVSNYFAIEPSLGTMADFETLVAQVHQLGMHLILDFVLNHTSDQHPWFKDALNNPDSLFRDYYIWQDGFKQHEPNNWGSFFGGSVWQQESPTGQYYFHLFDKHMPDLNWRNPEVIHAMIQVAAFWVNKGIDGLRLDAFIHTAKANFRQNYPATTPKPHLATEFYANLPGVHDNLRVFVTALKQLNPDLYILGEAASANPDLLAAYTRPGECDSAVTFRTIVDQPTQTDVKLPPNFQLKKLDLPGMKREFAEIQAKVAAPPALYWSNHDMARLAERYVDPTDFANSYCTLALMMYLQRGTPIIYYGEELGQQGERFQNLNDFEDAGQVAPFVAQSKALGYRDTEILDLLNQTHKMTARGPMAWTNDQYRGFSEVRPWKWGEKDAAQVTTKAQRTQILDCYRQIIKFKQQPVFAQGAQAFLITPAVVYGYLRTFKQTQVAVVCNYSATDQQVNFPQEIAGNLYQIGAANCQPQGVTLAPYSSVVLKFK
ncbi:MAG: alpha-glucosidase [Lactobacillus sp.]|nr:alpha-glucosidase [Lactobacillus sp.]